MYPSSNLQGRSIIMKNRISLFTVMTLKRFMKIPEEISFHLIQSVKDIILDVITFSYRKG